MIKCKICGHEVKYRLIEHIIKVHKISIEEYKNKYGDVVSDEYREKVSKKNKEKWKEKDYREKVLESRNWIYTDSEIQEKRRYSIKKYYENGGKVWCEGLTKDDDYLEKHSIFMKERWNTSELKYSWDQIQQNEELKNEWRMKISNTITNKIINNEYNYKTYCSGWYKNEFWYQSSLELDAMKLFDELNIKWVNNTIKIKYKDKNGEYHNYIPDFEILLNNKKIIIEMKGWDWDGLTEIKANYAKKLYEYYIFYNIDELKKFIINYENN